jgi:hypothetical protein
MDQYHRPDVNHEGDMVVFTANQFIVGGVGTIWTMKIDGSAVKQINLAGSDSIMARWYPGSEQFVAYYGKDTAGNFGISVVGTNLPGPANGDKICDTNVFDWAGFDLNKSQSGPLQIIFSHREIDTSFKLYQRQVQTTGSCTGTPALIEPLLPPGVISQDLDEKLPVISFAQNILASAVEWPTAMGSVKGIRLRGIEQDGSIGLPLTFQIEGMQMITGVSFAEKDKKIYLSAKTTAGDDNLYYIGVKEILEGFTDLVSVQPAQIPPPIPVSPKKIQVGSGKNIWPSGINEP